MKTIWNVYTNVLSTTIDICQSNSERNEIICLKPIKIIIFFVEVVLEGTKNRN